ncbi:hypothetical protein [Bacillus sp. ISL-45]|nr:hypothetical protein [Bacillus sp. ISL-45]
MNCIVSLSEELHNIAKLHNKIIPDDNELLFIYSTMMTIVVGQ